MKLPRPKKLRSKQSKPQLRIPDRRYATAGTDAYVKEFDRLNMLTPVEYKKNG